MPPSRLETLQRGGPVLTAVDRDGEVLALFSLSLQNDESWRAMAMLSYKAGPRMLAITRAALAMLALPPFSRVEVIFEPDMLKRLPKAERWLRVLGFRRELALHRSLGGELCVLFKRSVQ